MGGFDWGRFAGGFAVGAGQSILDDIKAQQADAMAWAKTQREESLKDAYRQKDEERRYQNQDSGTVDSYGAKLSNREYADMPQDEGIEQPKTAREYERRQEVSKAFVDKNGNPITVQQELDYPEAQKNRGLIAESQEKRAFEEAARQWKEGKSVATPGSIDAAKKLTPEEQDILDSWKDTPEGLQSIKAIEQRQKHADKLEEKAREASDKLEREKLSLQSREERAAADRQTKELIASLKGNGGRGKEMGMTDNQRILQERNTRKDMLMASTIDEVNSINATRKELGYAPLPIPEAVKKRNEKQDESESLAEYKKKRSYEQALIDILPGTPSAEERAKGMIGSKSAPKYKVINVQ